MKVAGAQGHGLNGSCGNVVQRSGQINEASRQRAIEGLRSYKTESTGTKMQVYHTEIDKLVCVEGASMQYQRSMAIERRLGEVLRLIHDLTDAG